MRWPLASRALYDVAVERLTECRTMREAERARFLAERARLEHRIDSLMTTIADLRKQGAEPVTQRPTLPAVPVDPVKVAIFARAAKLPMGARLVAQQKMGEWAMEQRRLGTDDQAIIVGIEQGQEVEGIPE